MIRIARESDIPQMLAIYGPYVLTTTYSFEYEVPTESEFLDRFRRITAQFPWLVWEEEGRILGYAYGSAPFERVAYQWCAEDSLYLLPEAQGKGIGKKLLLCLEKLLTFQGYRKIYAIITEENIRSRSFHGSLGYTLCGDFRDCGWKFGRLLGVVWMEKDLVSGSFPSNIPVSWLSTIQDAKNFTNILDILSLFY